MTSIQEKSTFQIVDKLPAGPRRNLWVQTIWAIVNPLDWLETMQARYGDIFLSPPFAGFPQQVVVSNPQAIQQIFTADYNQFASGSGSRTIQPTKTIRNSQFAIRN